MIEHFLHQELKSSTINENEYLPKNSIPIIPPKTHPTLTALNQIDPSHLSSSSDDWLDEHIIGKDINYPSKKCLNSYRTVPSSITNIAPMGHSTKLPAHTTINTSAPPQVTKHKNLKDQDDDIRPVTVHHRYQNPLLT